MPTRRSATAPCPRTLSLLGLVVHALSGCGQDLPSQWDLGPEPRMVGIRVEVVEPGPFQVELLATPADRTRMQPLPLDVIEARVSVLDESGIVDGEAFDPVWLLCRPAGICLSTLRRRSPPDCEDWEGVEATACRLGQGDGAPIQVPGPLGTKTDRTLRIAAVMGVPGLRTTEECLAELARVAYEEDLGDCRLAYAPFVLGPPSALEVIGQALFGGAVADTDPEDGPAIPVLPEQPYFNPEVPDIRLLDPGFEVTARAQETTLLPPHRRLELDRLYDPRDVVVGGRAEGVAVRVFSDVPGVVEATGFGFGFGGTPSFSVLTGDVGQRFRLFVVVDTVIGGHALAEFSFRVAQD